MKNYCLFYFPKKSLDISVRMIDIKCRCQFYFYYNLCSKSILIFVNRLVGERVCFVRFVLYCSRFFVFTSK